MEKSYWEADAGVIMEVETNLDQKSYVAIQTHPSHPLEATLMYVPPERTDLFCLYSSTARSPPEAEETLWKLERASRGHLAVYVPTQEQPSED